MPATTIARDNQRFLDDVHGALLAHASEITGIDYHAGRGVLMITLRKGPATRELQAIMAGMAAGQ